MARSEEEAIKLLNPDRIKRGLMFTGMFVMAFDFLRASIEDHIREFFAEEYSRKASSKHFKSEEELVPKPSGTYRNKVRALHKDILIASCLWLKQMDVLVDGDIETVKKLQEFRNRVVHRPGSLLFDTPEEMRASVFDDLIEVLRKVDSFWGRTNMDFVLDPEDKENVTDWESIHSASFYLVIWARTIVVAELNRESQDSPNG